MYVSVSTDMLDNLRTFSNFASLNGVSKLTCTIQEESYEADECVSAVFETFSHVSFHSLCVRQLVCIIEFEEI